MRLLLAVAGSPGGTTARELAGTFRLTVPTAHNLLRTLVAEGVLAKDGPRYLLGPMAAVIAYGVSSSRNPTPSYLEALREVSRLTGESVYLGSWRSGQVTLLAGIPSTHDLRVALSPMGASGHLHARATSKLLLALARSDVREAAMRDMDLAPRTPHTLTSLAELEAQFERIRQDLVAYDIEEYAEGAVGVSVPIWAGDVVAACLSLHAPASRYWEHADEYLKILRRESARVGHPMPRPREGFDLPT